MPLAKGVGIPYSLLNRYQPLREEVQEMAKIRRKVGGPIPTAERGTMRVHGLAAALVRLAPDVAATVQIIRHWTREGVLFPVQHQHAGPGKHREYAPDAIYEAAILFAINDMGLPISGSRALTDALTMARFEIAQREIGKGKKKPRLVLMWTPARMMAVGVYGEGRESRRSSQLQGRRRSGDDQHRSRKAVDTGGPWPSVGAHGTPKAASAAKPGSWITSTPRVAAI